MQRSNYETRTVLITVRAAPNPSKQYNETSCVAGIDIERKTPLRLFPMPARFLNDAAKFRKYSVVEVPVMKAPRDSRPESFHVDFEAVKEVDFIKSNPKDGWAARWELVQHFSQGGSVCDLRKQIAANGKSQSSSLTLVKPREITEFIIERKPQDDWTDAEIAKMSQQNMFLPNRPPGEQLEFIPYKFRYQFKCEDPDCSGHEPSILDWELSEAYRQWSRQYGDGWEHAIRTKFEDDFIRKKNTHFFMGTNNQYPESWMIIGIYYPPFVR